MEDARALNIPIACYSDVHDAIKSIECRVQEILSPTPEEEHVDRLSCRKCLILVD